MSVHREEVRTEPLNSPKSVDWGDEEKLAKEAKKECPVRSKEN